MDKNELIRRLEVVQSCDGVKWNFTPEELAEHILASNPKEPEAVHGNEAEKEVCDHTDENGYVARSVCIKCGKDMRV